MTQRGVPACLPACLPSAFVFVFVPVSPGKGGGEKTIYILQTIGQACSLFSLFFSSFRPFFLFPCEEDGRTCLASWAIREEKRGEEKISFFLLPFSHASQEMEICGYRMGLIIEQPAMSVRTNKQSKGRRRRRSFFGRWK